MRRVTIVFGCLFLVVFSACAARTFAPEEVLRRAVIASQRLSSARYSLAVALKTDGKGSPQFAGDLQVSGILRDHGHAVSGSGTLALSRIGPRGRRSLALSGEYSKISDSELFLRFVSVSPFNSLPGNIPTDLWLHLNMGKSEGIEQSTTPDAMQLLLQARALKVVSDPGVQDTEFGRAYHYNVTLDTSVLRGADPNSMQPLAGISGTGELWIDADTFVLRKALWSVRVPQNSGVIVLDIEALFSDHNNVSQQFSVPASAIDVNPEHVFAIFSSGSLLPQGLF